MGNSRAIGIITPAAPRSRHGNRVTALRWARLLRQLGCHPFLATDWQGRPADALLAVHATKSADAVDAFLQRHPDRKVAVLLAGTDIYPHFDPDPRTTRCLDQAEVVLVLQPEALDFLPGQYASKARVILQSATVDPQLERSPRQPGEALRVCMLAHLRAIKAPMLAFAAEQRVDPNLALHIEIAGQTIDEDLATAVRQAETPRCRWIGPLSHPDAIRLLRQSHVCLLPSAGEGGANVVSESIAAGTPLLASKIPGNTGLLGSDWPGLFPPDDAAALALLLERLVGDQAFHNDLCQRTLALQPKIQPERERQSLAEVIDLLGIPT